MLVRQRKFIFTQQPQYYYRNKFITHFLNALSTTFPGGEDFFVRSVRRYRNPKSKTEFEKEISIFIGQESFHSLAHQRLNEHGNSYGIPMLQTEKMIDRALKQVEKLLTPKLCLAVTVALEHYTATMGNELLTNRYWLNNMSEPFDDLWKWHSQEEVEHKHVAFQVWKLHEDDELVKNIVMVVASVIFWIAIFTMTEYYLIKDRHMSRFEKFDQTLFGLWKLCGPRGFITNTMKHIPRYFSSSFVP